MKTFKLLLITSILATFALVSTLPVTAAPKLRAPTQQQLDNSVVKCQKKNRGQLCSAISLAHVASTCWVVKPETGKVFQTFGCPAKSPYVY